MEKTENRFCSGKVEVRKAEDGQEYIEGRGIVFNDLSNDLGGFQERILPGALDGVDLSDVYSFVNHDPSVVLGRTKSGTMDISVRSDGVYYKVSPPKGAGRYLENIKRGDIDGSSFSFRVDERDVEWEKRDGDVPIRNIKKFTVVREIGPVVGPAYTTTTAEATFRALEEFKKSTETYKKNFSDTTIIEESVAPPKPVDEETKMKGDLIKSRLKFNK